MKRTLSPGATKYAGGSSVRTVPSERAGRNVEKKPPRSVSDGLEIQRSVRRVMPSSYWLMAIGT